MRMARATALIPGAWFSGGHPLKVLRMKMFEMGWLLFDEQGNGESKS